jgi:hypothetical protein
MRVFDRPTTKWSRRAARSSAVMCIASRLIWRVRSNDGNSEGTLTRQHARRPSEYSHPNDPLHILRRLQGLCSDQLRDALGPVDVLRFLALISPEAFNYQEWRRDIFRAITWMNFWMKRASTTLAM